MTPMRSLALLALLASLLSGCAKEPSAETPPDVRVDVRTALVRFGEIDETISATGSTATLREAQLRSPITGVIVSFKFFNGDRITKGVVVAVVRTKEAQAAIQGAEELLRSALSDAQKAEAARALALANETANTVRIAAPFEGFLNSRSKNEMEVVSEGEQIAALLDPTSAYFIAEVPSASVRRIRVGQHAVVHFASRAGRSCPGAVQRIEPQMNPGDQTARVHIGFDEPAADLESSLFGEASIIVGRREHVLIVPVAALLRDDEANTTSVMVIGADSLAHKVEVSVGLRRDTVAEVASGALSAGTAVVTEGAYGLPDSTKVRVVR